jgi:hypothetical protein
MAVVNLPAARVGGHTPRQGARSEASVLRAIEGLKEIPGGTGRRGVAQGLAAAPVLSPSEKFGTDQGPLKKARELPGVKRAFVAAGVRYDLAFADPKHGDEYIRSAAAGLLLTPGT